MDQKFSLLGGGGWYLDGKDRYNCSGRYINDAIGSSYRNNARYSGNLLYDEEFGWYVKVLALGYIRKGSEIFVSYGKDYWEKNPLGGYRRRGVWPCLDTLNDEELEELDKDIGILT